ncbi:MAG TPA: sulfate ABC transporter permease subunit CysT [Candidatus Dormibacteraeota bacterium]|nr:sulfate ABC transporter permease subunit CysT [Candidatus Dormibacteraeota bacterium]
MTDPAPIALDLTGPRAGGRGAAASLDLTRVLGPALATTYLSLLVLLPLAAVLSKAFQAGLPSFVEAVVQPEALAALRLTVISSAVVVAVNALAGPLIAWMLVRDQFPGKRVVAAIVDLPFALPTVIAGLTLLSLYGPTSPVHVDVAYTWAGIVLALAFVTLPFSVRSVQPVLIELDREVEDAAATLGASSLTTFRRVILPVMAPALLVGAGLGFARALGEFGSVVLISGNLPFKTELASVRIFNLVQSNDLQAAAAVSVELLLISLVVLLALGVVRGRVDAHLRGRP